MHSLAAGQVQKGTSMIRYYRYVTAILIFSFLNIFMKAEPLSFNENSGKNAVIRDISGLADINQNLYRSILQGDTAKARLLIKTTTAWIEKTGDDDLTISDSHYYAGVYYLITSKFGESERHFNRACEIREHFGIYDTIYAKSYYNISVIYSTLGDFGKMQRAILESIETDKKLYGESSPRLAQGYFSLAAAYIGMKEYENAIEYGNKGLKTISGHEDQYSQELADLYTNLGVCYIKLSDFSRAVLYLEKGEEVYESHNLPKDDRFLNLLNSLAAAYFFLGEKEKSYKYYNMGIDFADNDNTYLSQVFVISYAKMLGNSGNIREGESVFLSLLQKAGNRYGTNSAIYIYVLMNYADYLREFRTDLNKSLLLYEKCMEYLATNITDNSLKGQIKLGYALTLSENGETRKALETIQAIIYSEFTDYAEVPETGNPDLNLIKPDQLSLNLFKAKYSILQKSISKSHDLKLILEAAATSSLIVSIIDKVRLNISEEESRLILGDRYRDYYIYAIRDCGLCFGATADKRYIDKAFEFSEKSKVAALLTATRELSATQLHIPVKIAEEEKKLQDIISFYSAKVSEVSASDKIASSKVSEWKDIIFNTARKRDSLVSIFEKDSPEYYLMKYNTRVIGSSGIHKSEGRRINYLNYVADDTVVYILVANRKVCKLVTVPVDQDFYLKVSRFSDLIKFPSPNNARADFEDFQKLGSQIYDKIFRPVESFLVSNRLLISPDNLLAVIPFESLPMHETGTDKISYGKLPYMIRKYEIYYAYSATFLAESLKSEFKFAKSLVAFAPSYKSKLNTDLNIAVPVRDPGSLTDLPYARKEAEFVSSYFGGQLYKGGDARESVFKKEAGKYDIIHLAMHTMINDNDPMHSKMVFAQGSDQPEDGLLNTFEVYGVPLKAKMTVLSSCNTGTGMLYSGEGILSLARGFAYSGCESVVMSLWEIDDRSGSDLVMDFYRFLKKGYSKSTSLRKARLRYLEKADLLRSHPHFWSSLVIYGNNDRLYFDRQLILIFILSLLIAGFSIMYIYFRPR